MVGDATTYLFNLFQCFPSESIIEQNASSLYRGILGVLFSFDF